MKKGGDSPRSEIMTLPDLLTRVLLKISENLFMETLG